MDEKPAVGKKKRNFWFTITHTKSMTAEEYKSAINKVIGTVGIVFLVSLLVFIALGFIGGIQQVVEAILSSNLYLYALAFLSVFIGYLISFGKWTYFMRKLGIKVSLKKNLAVYLSLYSMDLTPGKIGRVVTAYTLSRITKIKVFQVLPIVAMDTVTDFLGMAVVALAAAVYFNQFLLIVVVADFISIMPAFFVLNDWFFKLLKKLMKKSEYLEMITIYGEEYFASQSKLNSPRTYLVSMMFTIPSAILYSLSLYFVILAVTQTSFVLVAPVVPLGHTVLIYYTAQVIGSVTSLPGNIGVTDGALVAMLGSVLHFNAYDSSAITIMTRIASLWFGVLIGGVFLFYTLRYWNPTAKELKRLAKRKSKKN
jgi:uncharacterized protein (TIRG00374 family)